jgi:hypothetical protein
MDKMDTAWLAKTGREKKYVAFCEDSILVSYNEGFMTSADALSKDLVHGIIVPRHDYTFRLFGNTVMVSYLTTLSEYIANDTIYHDIRMTRVFAFDNGQWKMAGEFMAPQLKNYFEPIEEKNARFYKEYAGVYQYKSSFADTFMVKEGKLYYAGTGDTPQLVFPVSESVYMIRKDLFRTTFGRDATGKVAYYNIIGYDGQVLKVPKVK